ncbi:MAG: hypothetical protein Q8Q52_03205, partial [Acidimicrobiia bacterium]|nr:hypothetical protein [Acidimicrobiia bacterium]
MARLIASFFGSGLLLRKVRGEDGGSGTIASFAALGVSLLIDPWWGRAMAMLAAVGFGWWAVTSLPIAGEDPGWVV